jgi:hypothetical protein
MTGREVMAKLRDKTPPKGYERHHLDPNLLRKIVPRTAAQALYPHLPSTTRNAISPRRESKEAKK